LGFDLGIVSTNVYIDWKKEAETNTSIFFPIIPYSPNTADANNLHCKSPLESQTVASLHYRHWLGTDHSGKDVLSGILGGIRKAILIGALSAFFAGLIGILLGGIAGYFGDDRLKIKKIALPVDTLIMRFLEIFNAIPKLLLLIAFLSALKNISLITLSFVIGVLSWTTIARLVRGELLRVRQLPYIEAATAMGFPSLRILFRHALPNVMQPVFIVLSFLGIGLNDTSVTLGTLLHEATDYPMAWWLLVFPSLFLFGLLWAMQRWRV
jgi:peptide/nickel transport system permease protein